MIRAVGNKRLDLNEEEFQYYSLLKESVGESCFRGLFNSDKNGNITSITPPLNSPVPMVSMFFLLNVMMNQKLRSIDSGILKIKDLEKRLKDLENRSK